MTKKKVHRSLCRTRHDPAASQPKGPVEVPMVAFHPTVVYAIWQSSAAKQDHDVLAGLCHLFESQAWLPAGA